MRHVAATEEVTIRFLVAFIFLGLTKNSAAPGLFGVGWSVRLDYVVYSQPPDRS